MSRQLSLFLGAALLGAASLARAQPEPAPATPTTQEAADEDADKPVPPHRLEERPFQAFQRVQRDLKKRPSAEPVVRIMERVDATIQETARRPQDADEIVRSQIDAINFAAETAQRTQTVQPEETRRVNDALADLNVRVGSYEQGKRFADRSLASDGADRDALISRSNANVGLKNYPAALDDASRAVKLAPDNPEAYTARSVAEYNMRQYQQAGEDARRALALDPNDHVAFAIMKLAEGKSLSVNVEAFKNGMGAEIQREYHGMVQQLNQAEERRLKPLPELTSGPRPGERFEREAAERLSVKDYYGAIESANKALAADPSSGPALYYRAAAYNLLGQYDRAANDATRALVFNPSDAGTHDTRAWAFNHMGRFRDAIADSNHSLEINPKNPYAFANLSYSHEQMGDFAAMLRELKTAALLSPQFETTYHDAASRHGLEPEPLPSDRFAPPQGPSPQDRERRRSFLFVVGSAVVGGVLIALGFLNLARDSGKTTTARRTAGGTTAPPKLEAGYTLGKRIGMGGMGIVYEAVDHALQRKVAIKVMREELQKDDIARQRFLDEARTVAALHHPGIVDIHAIVEDAKGVCLVFELVDGSSLDEVLRARGRIPLVQAKAVMRELCAALDFAHRHLVVHRDIKPSNVMIPREGGCKLMDFGISRQAREALLRLPADAAKATGTPNYMAPEQRFGTVRKESDVFSLGAVLYEMVTGRCPFPGADSEALKLNRGYLKPSQAAQGLPPELDTFIDHVLEPDPAKRVPNAREFYEQLSRVPERVGAAV